METPNQNEQSITQNREDSATFTRCSSCKHAKDVDQNVGTLFCCQHEMFVNAEADEIPDDCAEYESVNAQSEDD